MLEKFIQKDKNEELEKILEEKQIEERAKNLLQGILYKIEVSYKDYKHVKAINKTKKKYLEEILINIQKRCNQIKVINLSEKFGDEIVQKKLEKNKFYIDNNEIICYPIEEKILYAIEKKSNNELIVNNKYGITAKSLSILINTGKNIDKTEPLRDFNGWSWTTIKKEIENIDANLVYQNLQFILGEEFVEDWSKDTDGIIDYVEKMQEEITNSYNKEMAENIWKLLQKIAIINEIQENEEYKIKIKKLLQKKEEVIKSYKSTKENILHIYERKKEILKEIKKIDKILSQEVILKKEYEKLNEGVELHKKIFSIKVLKQQLIDKKQKLLNEIEENNYLLNPNNYIEEKNRIKQEIELLNVINYTTEQKEKLLIDFENYCLKYIGRKLEKVVQDEEIIKIIYKFRYFLLLPFNKEKNICEVEEIQENILQIEEKILKIAKNKKVITDVPLDVMTHVFKTRILNLEELYYKITTESEKYYVQIFDENITEERFEINLIGKTKINKKIKIFI